MLYKEFNVKYNDTSNGSIEGYASTWIKEPDSYGDIVKAGAFKKTLAERWNGGKNIPLLWSHKIDDIYSYIGKATAEEDEKGLHFMADFDGTTEAQRVRELYKDGRLSKFSFAYGVNDEGQVTLEDGRKANELRDLDLYEISCVCVPANEDAGIVEVKASPIEEVTEVLVEADPEPSIKSTEPEAKSGRRNRKSDEDIIKNIISLAQSLLDDETEPTPDDTEKNEPVEEEPEAKSEIEGEEPTAINTEAKSKLLSYISQMEA